MMLPKKVWAFWDGQEKPPYVEMTTSSWKKHLPGWEIRIVTGTETKSLVPEGYLPPCFDSLEVRRKADAARTALLRKHGGVWMDVGIVLNKNFDWLLKDFKEGKEFVGFYQPKFSKTGGDDFIENWWFATTPENALIKYWNESWTEALTSTSCKLDFSGHKHFEKIQSNLEIPENLRSYLYHSSLLALGRREKPGIQSMFSGGRVALYNARSGPLWYIFEETKDKNFGPDNRSVDWPDTPFVKFTNEFSGIPKSFAKGAKVHPYFQALLEGNTVMTEKQTGVQRTVPIILVVLGTFCFLLVVAMLVRWNKKRKIEVN